MSMMLPFPIIVAAADRETSKDDLPVELNVCLSWSMERLWTSAAPLGWGRPEGRQTQGLHHGQQGLRRGIFIVAQVMTNTHDHGEIGWHVLPPRRGEG
jgi:hypothetical protein